MDVSTPDCDLASVSAVSAPATAPVQADENLSLPLVSLASASDRTPASATAVVSEPGSQPVTVPEFSDTLTASVDVAASATVSSAAVESQEFFAAPKPRRDEFPSRSSSRQRARSVGRSPSSDRGFTRPDRSPSPVDRSPAGSRQSRVGRQDSQQRAARRDLDRERRPSPASGSGRPTQQSRPQQRAASRHPPPDDLTVADQKRDVAVRHLRTVLSQPPTGDASAMPADTALAVAPPQLPTKRKAEDTHQRRVCPSAPERVPASSPDVEMPVAAPLSVASGGTDSGTAPAPTPVYPTEWAADVEGGET
ncbi:flocculation protein FLO11-like [Schistocerca piceifrons]|uniref:flocculation protein FLO11-like n=1 Tax=Schistocerca piceifrons TaxID=274613 RepID=UPI001F5FF3F9|nr:flocculation protein FLO11-like [Schistocerca piceifrons]